MDRYIMTREQIIAFAKRNLVDNIWKSAHIEGINITFPETQKIIDGGNVAKLRIDEIQTINNLKHAWIYVLNSLDQPNNINMLKSINSLVGSNLIDMPGKIRNYDVGIGGTDWKPEIPIEEDICQRLEEFNKMEDKLDQCLEEMCYLMRTQIFSDGNKRTAMLFTNKIMIENGLGIINIPVDLDIEFGEKLITYYETSKIDELKKFLRDNCLTGINYNK